ncbi:MAG: 16S rRNA (cytosine(1402)-N(4))-methyltransferase RsmH [Candidatus Sungbacteria bacterium]|uniref:Ribosomal RNA small subunit methyltransferase H n=1 Tax=Candidatus Sungiibacteriota bacterium TaxID=2750080 RepID=A0A9D6LTA8_9BACT|nr:16S rRNA (cytosine(1402)-N(4))-methyltransferase RsmH [Candidatus Sungbacteria bacterium]
MEHSPVLLQAVLEFLDPQKNDEVIDATVDGGGHAEALIPRILPNGRLLGIDRDPTILVSTRERLARFGDRVILAEGNFENIRNLSLGAGVLHPRRILFDLGFSSYHLASSGRGFSFQKNDRLDMRYNPHDTDLTAKAIVNHSTREALEKIFTEYGQERYAKKIASAITSERKHRQFETTNDLSNLIKALVPRSSIHPATRVFQALRIAVNDELGHAERGIREALGILESGGRVAVISFHSLEDRIVKNIFKESKTEGTIITPKPVNASREEIKLNPRARSAKLRVFQKI